MSNLLMSKEADAIPFLHLTSLETRNMKPTNIAKKEIWNC